MPVSTPNGYLDFTNATPRATKIIATSNVGIGTVIPEFSLDVHGTANVGTLTATTATVSGNVYAPNLPLATIGSNLVTWNDSTGVFQDSGGLFSNKLAVVSEQPPSALAGASTTITNHGVYKVTASTGSPENAFDKSAGTSWTASSDYGGGGGTGVYVPGTARLHTSTEQGDWIALEFPYKTTLRHLTFTGNTEKANLYATNDGGITWTELKNWESGETTVVVDASGSYKKYGLVTTKTTGSATLSLTELRFFTESFAIDGGVVNTSGPTFVGGNALIVPNGTTTERPSTAVVGMIRYNSESGYFETYTISGWGSIATPPSIVSFSPNPFAYANVTTEVITITGSFFDAQSIVQLEGADGTLYNTTNFTFVDNATIRFTIGTLVSGQLANRPYKIAVTNGAGLTTKSTQTLGFGNPSIVSFSPNPATYANVTTEDITVTGSFFDAQSSVQLEGVDGTLYNTTNFTFVDSGAIRFTIGTLVSGQAANRPYKIAVTNGAGLTTKSTQTLGFGNPTWSSPASGSTQSFDTVQSTTLTLSATDALGGSSVSYSLVSGSLPGGVTLSGSTISGTSTESDGTTNTVTIRATDTVDTSAYTDLTFTIVSTAPGEAVFTTTGTTSWTVPTGVTSVSAVAVGGGAGGMHAPGGGTGSAGGGGALTYANSFSVTPGETLNIIVGAGGAGGIYSSSTLPTNGGETSIRRSSTKLIYAGGGTVQALTTRITDFGIGGSGGGTVTNTSYKGGDGAPSETTSRGTRGAGLGGHGDEDPAFCVNGTTSPGGGGTNGGGAGGYGVATTVGLGGGCTSSGGGGGGGGVNLYGTSSGTSVTPTLNGGPGGPGNASEAHGQPGGSFGGGGGSADDSATQGGGDGGQGAVRIIWGANRSFPSASVGESSSYGFVSTY
jgi:hypothetical protein